MVTAKSLRAISIVGIGRALSAMLVLGSSPALASEIALDQQVQRYRNSLAASLAPEPRAALQRIDGVPRQLLALRSYLKAHKTIDTRWSWSQDQMEAFASTPEYRDLLEEVRQIQNAFEAQNEGFTLYANTDARSLDVQLERWNENRSVESVARVLDKAVRRELVKADYPDQPDSAATNRLAQFLRGWQPPSAAALAAPGLSKHGQLRAIDFAIFKGGKLVAPTNLASAETVWQRQGWSERLKRATEGTSFVGPLKSPNEPWHYEYVPAEPSIRVAGDCERPSQSARC